ncbi:MAG: translation elongation factor Ts [Patescibacteria group bacterium]|jgi:elongation factor Ts
MGTELIQQIRNQTGAGVLDIKKALVEAKNDANKAIELLRKKGEKIAAKKQARVTSEGLVEAYIHGNGRVGVLVKLNCETDFVARTNQFKELAHQLVLHVAAYNPTYLSPEEVPAELVAKEKEVYTVLLAKENKPANMMEKIIAGKLQKYYAEVCLLQQPFMFDETKTVQQIITGRIAELGENIKVAEFKRISL